MKFINRKKELEFLKRKYKSNEAELIILYGRRRVGKTELLMQFGKSLGAVYFLGRLESREDTLKRFNSLLIEVFGDIRLLSYPLNNWDNIFDYIYEKSKKRWIIMFDEFPFLVDRFPEITSILQEKWDAKLKNSKLMLVLSGSSITMMERYVLGAKSPLYGRRTGQWRLDKLNPIHLHEFFPTYGIKDLITVYSCLDTIPGYLLRFSPEKDVFQNISEKMLAKGEFLYEEIEILLKEEFRDPSNYMSILSAIAGGLASFSDIHSKTGLDKSLLSKYLYILENVGVVERSSPVTEGYKSKLKARRSLYSLKDNFFDFWFRFVYINKQELEKGNVESILTHTKKELSSYMGRKFEQFVLEVAPLLKIGPYTHAGRWWQKDLEIDIIFLNENTKEIVFVECKWQDDVNAEQVLQQLKDKAREVHWNLLNRKESYMIFARSFKKKMDYCFDFQDLEQLFKKKHQNI